MKLGVVLKRLQRLSRQLCYSLRCEYDALRRPTHLVLTHTTEAGDHDFLAERMVYGEALEDPESSNLRGKAYRVFDGAGVVTSATYDFKGNLLEGERRLLKDSTAQVEWPSAVDTLADPGDIPSEALALLDDEYFLSASTYDALNRPTSKTAPDGSVHHHAYNEAGLLESVPMTPRRSGTAASFA